MAYFPSGAPSKGDSSSIFGNPAAPTASGFTFQGNWGLGSVAAGTYRVSDCLATGALRTEAEFCDQVAIGTSAPIGMTLTQTDRSIEGFVFLGTYSVPVSGLANGRHLFISGSTPFTVAGFSQTGDLAISNWNTDASASGGMETMSGSFNSVVTVRGYSGSAVIVGQITLLTR